MMRSDKYWVSFSRQKATQAFQKSNTCSPFIPVKQLWETFSQDHALIIL